VKEIMEEKHVQIGMRRIDAVSRYKVHREGHDAKCAICRLMKEAELLHEQRLTLTTLSRLVSAWHLIARFTYLCVKCSNVCSKAVTRPAMVSQCAWSSVGMSLKSVWL
jgi:hypothetical protein